MFKKGFDYVLMAEADGAGGTGGGDTPSSSNDGATTAQPRAPGDTGVPAPTALAAVGDTAPKGIPEKFQVKKDDGTLDFEASSTKLTEAYAALEKRVGSGDMPPKTPEEYVIEVPDVLKDNWNPDEDVLFQDFKKNAHAEGLSQKQFDFVMNKYFDIAPKLIGGAQQLSSDECVADLKGEWRTDAEYNENIGKAYDAAVAYGDKDADGLMKDYGNDPRMIRLLARVGKEMGEDTPPNPDAGINGQSVETVMASQAYMDPKHPDHARVSAQVQKHFIAIAKAQERAGNVPLL